MKLVLSILSLIVCTTTSAYQITPRSSSSQNHWQHGQKPVAAVPAETGIKTTRRGFLATTTLIGAGIFASSTTSPASVWAFDGTGSTAYSGYNPATKAEMKRTYKARIAADIRDFNALGDAIYKKGETSGAAWTNFFIQFARREPDEVGRTYAALVDLRGLPINKKEFEGGDGMLLANTFTKAGKPPDNTPAVQAFKKVIRVFDPIEDAGKKSDINKAKSEYAKAKPVISAYLTAVEMPSDLNDPLYQ